MAQNKTAKPAPLEALLRKADHIANGNRPVVDYGPQNLQDIIDHICSVIDGIDKMDGYYRERIDGLTERIIELDRKDRLLKETCARVDEDVKLLQHKLKNCLGGQYPSLR